MRRFKAGMEDWILNIIIYVSIAILLVVTIYPFMHVIALSFNDANDSIRGGITIWPRKFTLFNYQNILGDIQIYRATLVSILRTVVGTLLSLVVTIVLSYILSRKDFVLRKPLTVLVTLTMYFSGGVIPTYFLFRSLGLINNFAVYILPGLISAWNVMVVRTYMESLPESLIESARLDGAKELTILRRIIFPLITPVVATVALFYSVSQWNSWFDTYIYASSKPELSTLQFELMKKLSSAAQNLGGGPVYNPTTTEVVSSITPNSVRATMTVVATVPILLVYPFLQKYFVAGLTLGGVKE